MQIVDLVRCLKNRFTASDSTIRARCAATQRSSCALSSSPTIVSDGAAGMPRRLTTPAYIVKLFTRHYTSSRLPSSTPCLYHADDVLLVRVSARSQRIVTS